MKQVASHFGGTRNGLAISWPRRITDAGGLRTQFHHVIDLAPTILEAAGIEAPTSVNGIQQMPIEGTSMGYTFGDPDVASARRTQYFEMLGNRGIYHDGFMASCFHGRVPWVRFGSAPFDGPQENWELYDIREDFSQNNDLAADRPELLAEMRDLFESECLRNGVYPLRDAAMDLPPEARAPIALAGMIMRNSVILVDQIEQDISHGLDRWHAVIEATVRRFRPIVLTALAAVLAMIPLSRSVFFGPMAVAIMGGLVVATALTLLFLPALYAAWFRVKESEAR